MTFSADPREGTADRQFVRPRPLRGMTMRKLLKIARPFSQLSLSTPAQGQPERHTYVNPDRRRLPLQFRADQ